MSKSDEISPVGGPTRADALRAEFLRLTDAELTLRSAEGVLTTVPGPRTGSVLVVTPARPALRRGRRVVRAPEPESLVLHVWTGGERALTRASAPTLAALEGWFERNRVAAVRDDGLLEELRAPHAGGKLPRALRSAFFESDAYARYLWRRWQLEDARGRWVEFNAERHWRGAPDGEG